MGYERHSRFLQYWMQCVRCKLGARLIGVLVDRDWILDWGAYTQWRAELDMSLVVMERACIPQRVCCFSMCLTKSWDGPHLDNGIQSRLKDIRLRPLYWL